MHFREPGVWQSKQESLRKNMGPGAYFHHTSERIFISLSSFGESIDFGGNSLCYFVDDYRSS